ncbi:MAG: thioesterase family protein [Anaerolineales bacterium]
MIAVNLADAYFQHPLKDIYHPSQYNGRKRPRQQRGRCAMDAGYRRGTLPVHWRDQAHAAGGGEHHIEYLIPAFAGEEIEIKTWVENIRRVRSLRKYEFMRKADGKVLVRGETDWVFVDVKTGSPRAVPDEVSTIFSNQRDIK